MRLNTEGLILRESKTGEADRIVTVLTRDMGVVRAFVRGARSVKSTKLSATQLLSYSKISVFMNRDAYTIDEAEPIEVFFHLRSDMVRVSLAMYFCELLAELAPEGGDASEILSMALNSLYLLNGNKLPTQQLKAIFELRLLSLTGYMPNLVACCQCKAYSTDKMYFSPSNGQLWCDRCQPNEFTRPLDIGVVTAMRHICYAEPNKLFSFKLSPAGLLSLEETVQNYLLAQTQRRYKSLDFYRSVT
ncbi:MAG TPA: DNA repair protein RecO [Ruminococcaceae bacterium]|nr:DNA repair protein RecO [Oscillospiraceae bacterium]